ncbi:fructokinase [Kribbella sp. VKM Ac-2527]|uniref:Fructokinase n=1 Tax=Kribbella caucasensis TaxID=2512215 RepID=A0A4R6JFT7_9ACTN|nr:carbohydrate kinase [Kribbella sp. VKM Ac-2527]TDO34779.1 fructokinase [Kribbella sp. VKM Ac-2527]
MAQGDLHTSTGSSASVAPLALIVGEALVDIVGSGKFDDGPQATPGGSPANVAVGLARLGIPTELVTRLGTDPHGNQLAAHLLCNGVHLAAGSVEPGVRTSTATATLDPAGIASYEFDIVWEPPTPILKPGCRVVHTGSIASLLEPGAKAVREFVRGLTEQPVTVTLDPNARPTITPDPAAAWSAIQTLAAASDLIKLSDEDCAFLLPGASLGEVAAEFLMADRTKCVVITRGGEGAIGHTRTLRVEVDAPPVEVVDTVGAGDSFMAALIAGLLSRGLLGGTRLNGIDESALREVIAYAVKAAAITCTRHGADPPTGTEHTTTRM